MHLMECKGSWRQRVWGRDTLKSLFDWSGYQGDSLPPLSVTLHHTESKIRDSASYQSSSDLLVSFVSCGAADSARQTARLRGNVFTFANAS